MLESSGPLWQARAMTMGVPAPLSALPAAVGMVVVGALLVACSTSSPGGSDGGPNGDGGATPTDGGTQTTACTAARQQLLRPVSSVSTGEVTTTGTSNGGTLLYVDASAGGMAGAATNPRVYVSLANLARVDIRDDESFTSAAWDLALKRSVVFTNSGDAGPGNGGAEFFPDRSFESVTAADAQGKPFAAESFFEEDCEPKVDAIGAVRTSFDGWYDYDEATNLVTPAPGVWLVRGANGALYKMEILAFYAAPDGGLSQTGGRFSLRVAAL